MIWKPESERHEGGFTLIELLMVVVIIGILAAIVVVRFNQMQEKAFLSAVKSDLRNLSSQQETYYAGAKTYTSDLSAMDFSPSDAVNLEVNEAGLTGWAATATHDGLGARQCGIYYGKADAANASPATTQGSIACD